MLRFDFLGKCQLFSDPLAIIKTHNLSDIIACMAEIENAVGDGYYAAGYVAYEAAPAFNKDAVVLNPNTMPLLWFGIYQKSQICDEENLPAGISKINWQPAINKNQYHDAIAAIKEQIKCGNTYQTNYTIRLHGKVEDDPYQLYLHLLNAQRSDYSAYLDMGDQVILSASPELFFHYKKGKIMTKPMKGTAARGVTLHTDNSQRAQLFSEKNQAENMMIVDLLRNDLNQIANTASVTVDHLFSAEKYPTVWQLTSTISADLPSTTRLTDIFKALFPCGSITGAPKSSTMRLITQLEKEARGVYCGAIGIVAPNQEAIFNVAIRTLTINKQGGHGQYGVGGGITWDSTPEDEYQEVIDKARILSDVPLPTYLLETLLLDEGRYFLMDRHLNRLSHSADYFEFCYHREVILQRLNSLANIKSMGQLKVRLLLYASGKITLESAYLTPVTRPLHATLSPIPIDSGNRFLYHKTNQRDFYPTTSANNEYLLANERGELTEFVNGNMALFIAGEWLTPPVKSGLLAGTFREQLIADGILRETVLYVDDLKRAQNIAFINSVRKWQEVVWLGGV